MGRYTTTGEDKQPLDKIKLHFIQEGVFTIYPQRSNGVRSKCVRKINLEQHSSTTQL